MKVAITSMGSGMDAELDPRFGRTRWIIVADTETGESSSHENTAAVEAAHGAGIQTADSVARLGVEALITGNMGPKAFRALEGAGIRVYSSGPATVAEALKNFLAGKLPELSAAAAGACGSGGAGFGPGGSG
ncbi:MAG: NifB/NifX family molybdenum-iron cluster-binding protein, partial [Planctomycetota bacterium]